MSKQKPRNVAASVRQRLTDLARKQGEDLQLVMTHYVIERVLYRLGQSEFRDQFILKGAMLFRLWADVPHRPTRDLDLLCKGANTVERLVKVFETVTGLAVEDDGLTFDPATVTAGRIKEDQEYEGVRVHCEVKLGQARIDLQIDVGFGDAVTPRAIEVQYPTILAFPAPVLPAYQRETVISEKFQAMVALGIANSRMKDFFDLWILARDFAFDGPRICRAIHATFRRRKTDLPSAPPIALTSEFGTDSAKIKQWQAFLKKGKLVAGGTTLEQVCAFLQSFLMPPTGALIGDAEFTKAWPPAGPWQAGA